MKFLKENYWMVHNVLWIFCHAKVSQFVITHCYTERHQCKQLHMLLHTLVLQPGITLLQHGITVPNHMLTNRLQPTTNGTHHTTTTRTNSPPTTSTDQAVTSKIISICTISTMMHLHWSFASPFFCLTCFFLIFFFFCFVVADLDSQPVWIQVRMKKSKANNCFISALDNNHTLSL